MNLFALNIPGQEPLAPKRARLNDFIYKVVVNSDEEALGPAKLVHRPSLRIKR